MVLRDVAVLVGLAVAAGNASASEDACSVRGYGFAHYGQLADQHGRCIDRLSEGLATIKLDGLEGAVDADGRMVISPRFSWLRPFSQGLAAATDADTGKNGYVDRTGAWVIAPQFVGAENFSAAGTAVVRLPVYEQALIDREGKVLRTMPAEIEIRPAYGVDPFPTGVAIAEFKRPPLLLHLDGRQLSPPTGTWMQRWEPTVGRFVASLGGGVFGLLDGGLQWVARPAWQQIQPFHGQRAVASLASGRQVLIDGDGRQQGNADYAQLMAVAPGLWLASEGRDGGATLLDDRAQVLERTITAFEDTPFGDWFVHRSGERGLVLRNGRGQVVRHTLPAAPRAIQVRPRVLEVELEEVDGQLATQLFALDGRPLLPPRPDDGGDGWSVMTFRNPPVDASVPAPLATIRSYRDRADHGIGILTASGRLLFNPVWADFTGSQRFDGDGPLVIRTKTHRHGAIDGEGRWLVQPDLADLSGFRDGWAQGRDIEGRLLLIDIRGRRHVVPRFGREPPDADGLYPIADGQGRAQLFDLASGTFLFPGRFEAMHGFRHGLAPAQQGGLWGLVDRSGAWQAQPGYRDIEPFGPRFWRARETPVEQGPTRTVLLGPDGAVLTGEPWLSIYSSHKSHSGFWEQPWLEALTPEIAVRSDALVLADGVTVSSDMVKSATALGGGWMKVEFETLSGYVDPHGDWVIAPVFRHADQFVAGANVARVHDGRGPRLIDREGRTVFDGAGTHIGEASSEGVFYQQDARGRITRLRALGEEQPRLSVEGTRYGDIADGLYVYERTGDEETRSDAYALDGRQVISGIKGRLSSFSEGRALLRDADTGLFRYVDSRGRRALRGDFVYATVFQHGRAVVMDAQGYRMIDREGRTLLRVGNACGREVVLDDSGKQTWPELIEACVE